MARNDIGRWASRIAVAGAALQVVYGVLACAFRYPQISDRPFEALWAIVNVGMIANLVAWLSLKVARPRPALVGGGLAILGHLIRIAVSVVIEVRPDSNVDLPIVVSIVFMFAGLAVLGVATLRAGRLSGWPSRAPLLVLAAGLIAAPFYTIDKVVHFILLGLLWGSAWLFMAWTGYRQLDRRTAAEAAAPSVALSEH
ncbi:MAG TPA: hypothetical protein VGU21_01375 [Streptosporangiaceae bacterium]|nr:hypothetical protein [Streptosporangiaceae bacterium]